MELFAVIDDEEGGVGEVLFLDAVPEFLEEGGVELEEVVMGAAFQPVAHLRIGGFLNRFASMSMVGEIESAIENLNEDEFLRLPKWLQPKMADAWDRRMNQDSKDGKLDILFNEAGCERAAGDLNPWPTAG